MQPLPNGHWQNIIAITRRAFKCGFCGHEIATTLGWPFSVQGPGGLQPHANIAVCPFCSRPTFFEDGSQSRTPGVPFGDPVQHLPAEVAALYDEARRCTADNSYTAGVLAIRKLLMHIAVNLGAKEGQNFMEYVQYLADNGYVPPNGKAWVDHIRKKGNEANHEIVLMKEADARDLINFAEMLLKFIYEFPKRVPAPPAAAP
jgi:hypothetical protein